MQAVPVGERRVGRKKSEVPRDDTTVKLERPLADDARIVAAFRKIPLAVYLSDALRPIVAKDKAAELAKDAKRK